MQEKIAITFIMCIFRISKATALANQSSEDNTKLSLMLCSIFAWKQASWIKLMLFDVIAYKQIHPHYLWVLVFPTEHIL